MWRISDHVELSYDASHGTITKLVGPVNRLVSKLFSTGFGMLHLPARLWVKKKLEGMLSRLFFEHSHNTDKTCTLPSHLMRVRS